MKNKKRNWSIRGIITIIVQWLGILLVVLQPDFEISRPISQAMSDSSTLRWVSIYLIAMIAFNYSLFSRLIDRYWSKASTFITLGMLLLFVGSLIPYTPGENITGTHSLLTFSSVILILVVVYQLSKVSDKILAQTSRFVMFWVGLMTILIGVMASSYNAINFIAESLCLLALQLWTVTIIDSVYDYQIFSKKIKSFRSPR